MTEPAPDRPDYSKCWKWFTTWDLATESGDFFLAELRAGKDINVYHDKVWLVPR